LPTGQLYPGTFQFARKQSLFHFFSQDQVAYGLFCDLLIQISIIYCHFFFPCNKKPRSV